MPLNSTCTPPMVVASLPVVGSVVAVAAAGGPTFVPKIVANSPGETAPVA